ncbi:hypothetical protein RHMOL_Rhmol11G0214500 [Rhododendron molle]|uniref:Uncharacterized protein n=1 Tax=Rhododendron molle TaxID=49168 RepID=A0ACC0LUW9_RHOML|nr:hypothetical protein RHMOL_Rhmol11G0214500 [Rhododendron molle]
MASVLSNGEVGSRQMALGLQVLVKVLLQRWSEVVRQEGFAAVDLKIRYYFRLAELEKIIGIAVNVSYLNAKNSFKTQLQYSTAMAILNFKILLYSLSMFFFCILFPQTTSLTFDLTDLSLPDQNVNITTSPRAYRSTRGLEVTPNTLDANLQLEAGKVS